MLIEQNVGKYIRLNKLLDKTILNVEFKLRSDVCGTQYLAIMNSIGKKRSNIIKDTLMDKVRTPRVLSDYNGKKIMVFNDNLDHVDDELLRIRPVDFSFNNKGRSPSYSKTPRFSSSGILIIPHSFIHDYIDDWAMYLKVSFDRTSGNLLEYGKIAVALDVKDVSKNLNYKLRRFSGGLRTTTPVKFIDFINRYNKDINKFMYEGLYDDKNYSHGLIIFSEVIDV